MTCVIDEGRLPCNSLWERPGTIALAQVALDRDPLLHSYGIQNCRDVRGGDSPSKHGNAEAWDAGGNTVAIHRLVAAILLVRIPLHVQRVIWWRRIWDCRQGWHAYNGVNPHFDHAHIELDRWGATHLTMAAVVQAFGIPRHRRPPDVPRLTDIVASLRVPDGRVDLEYQGGVRTHGKARFYGSWFTLPPEVRANQAGRFLSIVAGKGTDPYAYTLVDVAGNAYDFTKGTLADGKRRGVIP